MKKILSVLLIVATITTIFSFSASAETFPDGLTTVNGLAKRIVVKDETDTYVAYVIYPSNATTAELGGYNCSISYNTDGDTFINVDRKSVSDANIDKYAYLYRIYKYTNNTWTEAVQGNITLPHNSTQFGPINKFVYSDLDIYKDGELFFPLPPKPLYQEAMEVGASQITNTAVPAVRSVMMTLTLCGVGLIALLVVLPLFGKIFHRYRR